MVLDLVKYIKNIKKCHKNMGNGSTGSPPSATDSGAQINKNEYHTRTASFFYAVFSYTSRNGAALAARVLWGHKKEFSDLLNRGT